MNILPILLTDFYKTDHRRQYPKGTTKIYSNLTPRTSRIEGIDKVVVFGIQYFVKEYLMRQFLENFFCRSKNEVVDTYKRRLDTSLGVGAVPIDHIEALHDLRYLPIKLKALKEGTLCPLRVPVLTITNTHPDFFWLTNFLETLLCNVLWQPMTSATIAYAYRKMLKNLAEHTSDNMEFVQWQGHDFSMRGHTSIESAMVSGAGHLLSFTGTDTIPAIDWLEWYYDANSEKELIGGSVPATEHSVMCIGSKETELETYRRLLTEVYPSGIVSVVSDTWDYFKVLTEILPQLKDVIMARNGKLVIRPDSGNPHHIICGDIKAKYGSSEYIGTMQILWDIFGGKINSKGYKELDSHIGCIYGDSITLAICEDIGRGLMNQKFASTNMVYGIGSYTYQYVTRDTLGFAMKSTFGVVDGVDYEIYKDPITDSGIKKSAKGLLRVNEDLTLSESVSDREEGTGLLETVFLDGVLKRNQSLHEIRQILSNSLHAN